MRRLFLAMTLCAAGCAGKAPPAVAPARPQIAPAFAEYVRPGGTEPEPDAEAPTPTLRVTKLTPTPVRSHTVAKPKLEGDSVDETDGASIDEPGRRPLLSLQGSPAPEPRSTSAEASSTWDSTEPRPSALDPRARATYKSAYRIYSERKPREALDAFAAFVLKYPDHPYVEQATYWRGECYAALGDKAHALEQFHGVVARFPGTPKAHEAEARIASLQAQGGKTNSDEGSSR